MNKSIVYGLIANSADNDKTGELYDSYSGCKRDSDIHKTKRHKTSMVVGSMLDRKTSNSRWYRRLRGVLLQKRVQKLNVSDKITHYEAKLTKQNWTLS